MGAIGVCLALASDGHSAYATPEASSTLFTVSGSDVWTASRPVNLRSVQARLYAWYPADESNLATVDNGTTRTVAITLPASQTFDGANATDCSQTDYLYGSASATAGDATSITVNRDNNNPMIYLQHALTRLIFTIEYKAGRVPDSEYDWVKSISLEGPFRAGAGTLQLNDGTLAFSSSATRHSYFFSGSKSAASRRYRYSGKSSLRTGCPQGRHCAVRDRETGIGAKEYFCERPYSDRHYQPIQCRVGKR